jgi:hypothetical protein
MTSGGVEESRTAVLVPPISIPTSSLLPGAFMCGLLFYLELETILAKSLFGNMLLAGLSKR